MTDKELGVLRKELYDFAYEIKGGKLTTEEFKRFSKMIKGYGRACVPAAPVIPEKPCVVEKLIKQVNKDQKAVAAPPRTVVAKVPTKPLSSDWHA